MKDNLSIPQIYAFQMVLCSEILEKMMKTIVNRTGALSKVASSIILISFGTNLAIGSLLREPQSFELTNIGALYNGNNYKVNPNI
jgi:hypothetical protein